VTLLLDDMRRLASSYPPVYAPNGSPVHRVERGGEVTFHGPGQLVMYPLLNLDANVRRRRSGASSRDLHGYLRDMEEVVIRTLMHYDVNSYRDPDRTGVWVNGMKIAASGVSCTRWITTHGLSLNVDVDLRYFDNDVVTPCGIGDRGVTSLARVLLGDKVDDDDDDDSTVVVGGERINGPFNRRDVLRHSTSSLVVAVVVASTAGLSSHASAVASVGGNSKSHTAGYDVRHTEGGVVRIAIVDAVLRAARWRYRNAVLVDTRGRGTGGDIRVRRMRRHPLRFRSEIPLGHGMAQLRRVRER